MKTNDDSGAKRMVIPVQIECPIKVVVSFSLRKKTVASASVSSQVVTLSQKALKGVRLSTSVDGTPTETLTLGTNLDGNITATVGGTVTAGDVLSITVNDPRFRYGPVTCSYTAKSGDTTGTIAQGLSNAIYNTLGYGGTLYTSIALYFPSYAGSVVTINPNNYYANVIYSKSVTGVATETLTSSANLNGNSTVTVGGSATTGDVVSLTVDNSNLPGGEETVSYTVTGGNTPTNIATGLKNAINASSNLTAIGVTATSSAAVVTVATEGTTYTTSLSGGATETLTLGTNANGNTTLVVGGKATNGDTVTVVTHNPLLPGGQESVGYTVGASDTLVDVAAGLVSNMNGNSDLQTLGVTAKNSCTGDLAFSQSFSGNGNLPSGESLAKVSATDAVPTTKTDTNSLNVTASASATLTWDSNGNMTSDGTNSYKWDAENRLIEIDYPGINNYSQFSFDSFGRNAKIVEIVSGSTTNTKQFIWCGETRCEQRDAVSSITGQFFTLGGKTAGSNYFYTADHLANDPSYASNFEQVNGVLQGSVFSPLFTSSIREMTNNAGAILSQLSYDVYGRVKKVQGAQSPVFQFGDYYTHEESGLNLTFSRAYSSNHARFISRDSIEEDGGLNLYAYMDNHPEVGTDPSGTCAAAILAGAIWIAGDSALIGAIGAGATAGILLSAGEVDLTPKS